MPARRSEALLAASLVALAIVAMAAAWRYRRRERTYVTPGAPGAGGASMGGSSSWSQSSSQTYGEGFQPIPVLPAYAPPYGFNYPALADGDPTGRNASGTVAMVPYSTQSRVSLERSAESPEIAALVESGINDVSGIGMASRVRALADPYRHHDVLRRLREYELRPGDPGYLEDPADDPPAPPAPPRGLPCAADLDADYETDGPYGAAAGLGALTGQATITLSPAAAGNARGPQACDFPCGLREGLTALREGLTSRRGGAPPNTLDARGVGLGSVRQDPRFEPGPPGRLSADTDWAPGSHAGGPTLGAYAPAAFTPVNTWWTGYVRGFGDPCYAQ